MQGMGTFRLGRRTVMYTVETIPKGKNRVLGTIQIMTGFIHISFGIILSTLTSVYTSFFVSGEIPFLGGASLFEVGPVTVGRETGYNATINDILLAFHPNSILSPDASPLVLRRVLQNVHLTCFYNPSLQSGYIMMTLTTYELSPRGSAFLKSTEVKGSQAMNIISAIFALLGILAFIVDLSQNWPFYSEDHHHYSLVMTGNRIAIVLLTFTILEFCIASATAYFWCRATRSDSNEAILIEPNTIRTDTDVPSVEQSTNYPPNSNDVSFDLKVETV